MSEYINGYIRLLREDEDRRFRAKENKNVDSVSL